MTSAVPPDRPRKLSRRDLAGLAAVASTSLLSGCSGGRVPAPASVPSWRAGASVRRGKELPDATFTDTSGRAFNLRTSPSAPAVLVFFGYSNCREACDTTLRDVAAGLRLMNRVDRSQIQAIFVTVDPQRDEPTRLEKFLGNYQAAFLGLIPASAAEVVNIAKGVGVSVSLKKKGSDRDYQIRHGNQVLGFSRGRLAISWAQVGTPADMAADFTRLANS